MQVVGLLTWWYRGGLLWTVRRVAIRLDGLLDLFSIGLLLRTLFAPFRQISAGRVDGPINIQIRAFFDKLISRVIGAIVRSIVLLAGVVAIVGGAVIGLIAVTLWLALPLLPIAGLVMSLTGYTPWVII